MGLLPPVTLVLGGARSGKSAYAEGLVERTSRPIYLATAEARDDDEMTARIAAHRARRGPHWTSVEEPLALPEMLTRWAAPDAAIMVDCLTLWVSNLIEAERDLAEETRRLLAALAHVSGPVVLVSNEIGLGIVPETPLVRVFRDHVGILHQELAQCAERVVLIVAGLPLFVKHG